MQILSRNGGRLVAGLLAGAALATLGTAAPASAQSGFVSIKPMVAPNLDVAQGAVFDLAARDSSGISFAESWKFVPASHGHVLIVNRHFKDGTTEMAMDIQDTSMPGTRRIRARARRSGPRRATALPASSGRWSPWAPA